MLKKFYIMCSYPDVHKVGTFNTIDEAREAFCSQYSGQTDEKNYYWTEADCDKHGRVSLTVHSECEVCDLARAGEEEQAARDADVALCIDGDPDAERERYERCEAAEYDKAFKRGLIAPRVVYIYCGRLVIGGEYDPRYSRTGARICQVEAVEYVGSFVGHLSDDYRRAWHARNYAGMLEALIEFLGEPKVLDVLQRFSPFEALIADQLDPLNDLTD